MVSLLVGLVEGDFALFTFLTVIPFGISLQNSQGVVVNLGMTTHQNEIPSSPRFRLWE